MKLLTAERVKRFFNSLSTKGRHNEPRYDNKCEKQILTERVLNKYFSGRYFRIIRYNALGSPYWMYIFVCGVRFQLGWGDKIEVYYTSASNLAKDNEDYGMGLGNIFQSLRLEHKDCLRLEGEEITKEQYQKVAELFIVENTSGLCGPHKGDNQEYQGY